MRFEVDGGLIRAAIEAVCPADATAQDHDAFVRIDAAVGAVTLLARDAAFTAVTDVPATVSEPGAVCVRTHRLRDLARELPATPVVVSLADGTLNLAMDLGRVAIPSVDAAQVARAAQVDGVPSGVEFRLLRDAIAAALPFIHPSHALADVLWVDLGKGGVVARATDTRRTARVVVGTEGPVRASLLLTNRVARKLASLKVQDEAQAQVRLGATRDWIIVDDTVFCLLRPEHRAFPIPDLADERPFADATISRESLASALSMIGAARIEDAVTLRLGNGRVELVARGTTTITEDAVLALAASRSSGSAPIAVAREHLVSAIPDLSPEVRLRAVERVTPLLRVTQVGHVALDVFIAARR